MIFSLNKTFQHFFKNASWLILGKVYRVVFVTFTTIYLSRYLGPEDFGLLSYSLSLVVIFSFFIGLGLESVTVRNIYKDERETGDIISSAILLRLLGWLFFFVIIVILCFKVKPNDPHFIKLMVILSLGYFFKIFEVFRFFFECKTMGRLVSVSEIFAITVSCFLKFYFIYLGLSLDYFFFTAALDILIFSCSVTFLFFNYRKNKELAFYKLTPSISKMKELFSQSWPLIFASGLYLVYSKIDQVMLGQLDGMHSVGIYAAAVKLSEGGGFIFSTLAVALYPLMLREKNVSQSKYIKQVKMLLSLMVVLSIILAMVLSLSSEFMADIIFGDQYRGVNTVLSIHVWGGLFIAINAISSKYLVTEGLQKHSIYKNILGIVINVVLNYVLIPIYGVNGAAFATVVSHFFSTYVYFSFKEETRELFWIQTYAISMCWLKPLVCFCFANRK